MYDGNLVMEKSQESSHGEGGRRVANWRECACRLLALIRLKGGWSNPKVVTFAGYPRPP